jgi:hypothetical protein
MDEADGRPGHVALQSGHLDAPADAPNPSLCLPHSLPKNCHPERNEVKPKDLVFGFACVDAHSKLAQYRRTP